MGVLLASLGLALSSEQGDAYRSTTTIRVHSDLVLIPVTVTDGRGKTVAGLEKEHFTLYEDEAPQEITHFGTEDGPASIGLVLDTSQSMKPRLRKAREAVAALLNTANSQDEFFLVQFSTRPLLVVPMTAEREAIRNRVERLEANGSTALLDAVTLALMEMQNAHNARKAIVIISDGEDNSSSCSMGDFMERVRESDALLYAIGITDSAYSSQIWPPPPKPAGSALLSEIANQTGGRLFEVNHLKQLPEIASRIGALLRNQYVLGYAPNNSEKNGRYHRVQVKLTKPKGFPRLHAVWRLGYYSPAE